MTSHAVHTRLGSNTHYLSHHHTTCITHIIDTQVVRLVLEVLARVATHRTGSESGVSRDGADGGADNAGDEVATSSSSTSSSSSSSSSPVYGDKFELVLSQLLQSFEEDRTLLEERGAFVLRQLSVLLDGQEIFVRMSRLLARSANLEFASLMVRTLNLILLTSSELFMLRASIRKCWTSAAGRQLFRDLYGSWTHNAVATFSLCLLAQQYELAAAIVFRMADVEVTVGFLMQVGSITHVVSDNHYLPLLPNTHSVFLLYLAFATEHSLCILTLPCLTLPNLTLPHLTPSSLTRSTSSCSSSSRPSLFTCVCNCWSRPAFRTWSRRCTDC
jgi:hypothetical protein